MIELDGVSKWYGAFQVLKECTTAIAKGEVVVVCGPSGSGKSTLIKCINGLEPFDSGSFCVAGTSVGDPATDLPALRAKIGMVFQSFELFPHLTALENLKLAQVRVLGRTDQEAEAKGMGLLARVGLTNSAWLKDKRKYAVLMTFVAAAVLTPPDPISQIGLAVPTLLLYEISIHMARMVERQRAAAEAASEAEASGNAEAGDVATE